MSAEIESSDDARPAAPLLAAAHRVNRTEEACFAIAFFLLAGLMSVGAFTAVALTDKALLGVSVVVFAGLAVASVSAIISAPRQKTRQTPRRTAEQFSLRTLFVAITCAGLFCAGLRVAEGGFLRGAGLAAIFVSIFLCFYSLVLGKRELRRGAGCALAIFLLAFYMLSALPHVIVRRMQCQNNLRQIAQAILLYESKYGALPPAYVADKNGKPLYSWRVAILPFLDNQKLYDSFKLDEPWDSPANLKAAQSIPSVYHCPCDTEAKLDTSYVVVVGPNTPFTGAIGRKTTDLTHVKSTILVVEVHDSGIKWTAPRDLYVGQMAQGVNPLAGQGISSRHQTVNVVHANGDTLAIEDDADPREVEKLLNSNCFGVKVDGQ